MEILRTKLKKKFNGKSYKFYDSYRTEGEAQKEFSKLKGKGNLVRITRPKDRLLPYYELWVRRGNR